MNPIRFMQLTITTADVDNAGTDADVFLGLHGREFYVDSNDDTEGFEQGSVKTYRYGKTPNVFNASENDPRDPQLDTDQLLFFPVYLRIVPVGSSPAWKLQFAEVTFNGDPAPKFETTLLDRDDTKSGIWLGRTSGVVAYFRAISVP